MSKFTALGEAGAALLGGTLATETTLGGGSLSEIVRIRLADGRDAVVKGGGRPEVEARMLRAIADTGAPAPAVLAVGDGALVIEAVDAGGSISQAWPQIGAALATLHAAKGDCCGWDDDYAFARVAIENRWTQSWPAFWGERRLLVNVPHVGADLARRLEALAQSLPDRLPELAAPSLLHGDLWGGNVLVSRSGAVSFIDPACYYGHGEVDIAMLNMFDTPPPAFYDAYGTLEPGFDERQPIYRLWPALVHLRLFDSGYRGLVERLLSDAGV
ncbi:aminoglycoside phosphotransferase [Rhodomicrobium udaipurense JA643]|uniref:Fructosamine kinase family protein n=1 Tax=Rhodomicrobium udaipurense TaxID=1202716 RepID=A0A8I1GFM0_9HYPH|nr:fructosamine kinase family protein [Rhodomicrobium udaipurense]KAI96164.1 aminoglycoside phosphotransferase [Rhodomicrobium udaipurense JA643]MBJ7543698.1 fructosamine kinase family protein [Rhodomicrobium udaipurense]